MNYSMDIADAFRKALDNDNWRYKFNEELGILECGVAIKGKLQSVKIFVQITDDAYKVRCVCPLNADTNDAEVMRNLAAFLHMVTYHLIIGDFELDCSDGEISYKVAGLCIDRVPNEGEVIRSILIPSMMFEKYTPGIIGILFTGMDAETAHALCAGNKA